MHMNPRSNKQLDVTCSKTFVQFLTLCTTSTRTIATHGYVASAVATAAAALGNQTRDALFAIFATNVKWTRI